MQGKVERDPGARPRRSTTSPRSSARRGLDLAAVFEAVAEAVFELVPRATHVAIDLADDGRTLTPCLRAPRAARRRVQRAARWCAGCSANKARGAPRRRRRGARPESVMNAPRSAHRRAAVARRDIRGLIQVRQPRGAACSTSAISRSLCVLAAQASLAIDNARSSSGSRSPRRSCAARSVPQAPRGEGRFDNIIGESPAMKAVFAPAREGDRYPRHRLHRGRDRHRQGADRLARSTTSRSGATSCSSRRTAPRCPRTCSRASCSATSAARSPAPTTTRRACSRSPTAARCSSTRWARCR